MTIATRGRLAAASLVLLLCATGCIDRDVSGDQTTYDYAWWVPATLLLVSVVAFPAGLFLRRHSGRMGIGLMILSPILAVLIFPATILDKVKVDSQHFETHYGFWFSPSKHNVRFDDLSEMRLVTYETRTRRGGRRQKQKLVCVHKSPAPQDTVELGTLVKEAAPEILRRAAERGVAITEGGQ